MERGFGDQQDIVDDVEDAGWAMSQVLVGRRSLEWSQNQGGHLWIDNRSHWREVDFARGVQAGDETFQDHDCRRPFSRIAWMMGSSIKL